MALLPGEREEGLPAEGFEAPPVLGSGTQAPADGEFAGMEYVDWRCWMAQLDGLAEELPGQLTRLVESAECLRECTDRMRERERASRAPFGPGRAGVVHEAERTLQAERALWYTVERLRALTQAWRYYRERRIRPELVPAPDSGEPSGRWLRDGRGLELWIPEYPPRFSLELMGAQRIAQQKQAGFRWRALVRQAVTLAGGAAPRWPQALLQLHFHVPGKVFPDPDGFALRFLINALVGSGVLEDDAWRHVRHQWLVDCGRDDGPGTTIRVWKARWETQS